MTSMEQTADNAIDVALSTRNRVIRLEDVMKLSLQYLGVCRIANHVGSQIKVEQVIKLLVTALYEQEPA